MCTIGTTLRKSYDCAVTFKQCDLKVATTFLDPKIEQGTDDIRYLPFKREGSKGCWAGINNYGVSFVAADAYMEPTNANGTLKMTATSQDIFSAYTKILSDYKTAKDAAAYMSDFYKTFGEPDILLITDASSAYFIETKQGAVQCIERKEGFFASTNHFRMLYDGVLYPHNHSSYLRLARAEAILGKFTSPIQDVKDVLSDQYFGETVFSVCRVNKNTPPQEDPYYTQATAFFVTDGKRVDCFYQINGNPRTKPYAVWLDVFGKGVIKNNLTHAEVEQVMQAQAATV